MRETEPSNTQEGCTKAAYSSNTVLRHIVPNSCKCQALRADKQVLPALQLYTAARTALRAEHMDLSLVMGSKSVLAGQEHLAKSPNGQGVCFSSGTLGKPLSPRLCFPHCKIG
jgi:hypothetical protein